MVKASKSFLFTEGSLKVENKENLVDFVVTLYFMIIRRVIRSTESRWPNEYNWMTMTEIGEHDQKIDNDEH